MHPGTASDATHSLETVGSVLSQAATDDSSLYAALLQVLIEPHFIKDAARIQQGAAGTSTFDKILCLHTRERHPSPWCKQKEGTFPAD